MMMNFDEMIVSVMSMLTCCLDRDKSEQVQSVVCDKADKKESGKQVRKYVVPQKRKISTPEVVRAKPVVSRTTKIGNCARIWSSSAQSWKRAVLRVFSEEKCLLVFTCENGKTKVIPFNRAKACVRIDYDALSADECKKLMAVRLPYLLTESGLSVPLEYRRQFNEVGD